jgi:hypothetical protein
MRRILLFYVLCACVLSSRASATPQVVESATTVEAQQAAADLESARIERLERADLNARMNAVLEEGNKTIEGLQKMIDASPAGASTQDLERRMAQAKQDLTINLLRVQATFAREKGRVAQADEIDAQIDAILHPKRPAAATPANSNAARTNASAR